MEEQNQSPTSPATQTTQNSSSKQTMALGAAIAVVAAGAIGYKLLNKNKIAMEPTAPQPSAQTGTSTDQTQPTTATEKTYKDGTYDVVGNYVSPNGPETIKVKVTLKNNVVSEVEVTPQATNPFSTKWQKAFSENYKPLVVGKDINSVKILQAVAGSSLTPKGFNDAIEKVKAKATS